jgi:hypothetical protein
MENVHIIYLRYKSRLSMRISMPLGIKSYVLKDPKWKPKEDKRRGGKPTK